jgi:hypothetical protein
MRSKLCGLLLGFGLIVATAVPALACDYQAFRAQAQAAQQTAQAQTPPQSNPN